MDAKRDHIHVVIGQSNIKLFMSYKILLYNNIAFVGVKIHLGNLRFCLQKKTNF